MSHKEMTIKMTSSFEKRAVEMSNTLGGAFSKPLLQ